MTTLNTFQPFMSSVAVHSPSGCQGEAIMLYLRTRGAIELTR